MTGPAIAALFSSAPSLQERLPGIERAARSEATVLILGEPGSGRSSLARAIHHASARAAGPLVELDAGAVPSALFESELFGYEPGAFTGSGAGAPGRVAQAEGGSLIVDRVEEIPHATQPKLLRLLSERRFGPLGGSERGADVRFLAVASEDLPERVLRGAFREDLYFRLEVLTFRLAPLRRRPEDLEPLLEFFLTDLGERYGRGPLALSDRARRWMADYRWPGNLRELKNVLERAAILAEGVVLDPQPPRGLAAGRPRTLAEVEKAEIQRALEFTGGHQGRAAELLGISRKGLWEKRRRYGLP